MDRETIITVASSIQGVKPILLDIWKELTQDWQFWYNRHHKLLTENCNNLVFTTAGNLAIFQNWCWNLNIFYKKISFLLIFSDSFIVKYLFLNIPDKFHDLSCFDRFWSAKYIELNILMSKFILIKYLSLNNPKRSKNN